jgi:RNA polymerase sigma factor (sigma-70 family)
MTEDRLKDESERFLLAKIREGSADAFRRLVERFGGRLKAFAASRLAGTGIEPEDAVQETFLCLVRNVGQLAEVRSLQAYLFTITRRRIIDLMRMRGPLGKALPLVSGDSSPGVVSIAPGATPSAYARRDEAAGLHRAALADVLDVLLGHLKWERSFRDLKVLELVFHKRTSNQEAARVAGTSEPTVSRIVRAAVEGLRDGLRTHPGAEALTELSVDDVSPDLLGELWRENLFTCPKRSTLGSYALGVLEEEWAQYVRFHLDSIGCEYCRAHLADITSPERTLSESARKEIFASSCGFLK